MFAWSNDKLPTHIRWCVNGFPSLPASCVTQIPIKTFIILLISCEWQKAEQMQLYNKLMDREATFICAYWGKPHSSNYTLESVHCNGPDVIFFWTSIHPPETGDTAQVFLKALSHSRIVLNMDWISHHYSYKAGFTKELLHESWTCLLCRQKYHHWSIPLFSLFNCQLFHNLSHYKEYFNLIRLRQWPVSQWELLR